MARDVVRRPVAAPRYVVLQSGLTYRGARLAHKTHGTLNAARSNVIVYPTSYGAQHPDLEWLIAPGKPVDPTKYFIIIVNKFGNGLSSSPSNTPPFDRGRYPHFTTTDNVRVQQRLLAEGFGIERVALVYGFSSEHLIASKEQGGLVHLMSFEAALNKRSSLRVEPNRAHQRSDGRWAAPRPAANIAQPRR